MWARGQRPDRRTHGSIDKATRRHSTAELPPLRLADSTAARVGIGLRHPELTCGRYRDPTDPYDTDRIRIGDRHGSLAIAFCRTPYTVIEYGPRSLWTDAVGPALRWWHNHGQPGLDHYGITVSASGTHDAWLDTPTEHWPLTLPPATTDPPPRS